MRVPGCCAALANNAHFLLNVSSSTALIFTNKWLMDRCSFRDVGTLAALHFIVTSLAAWIHTAGGSGSGTTTRDVKMSVTEKIFFLATTDTSLISQNLSLMLNHVGVYQIAKIAMIPTSSALEYVFFGKTLSRGAVVAMVCVIVGVSIATVSDVSAGSEYGLAAAVVGVVSSSVHNVACARSQTRNKLTASEFIRETMPLQALGLMVLGPALDWSGVLRGGREWRWELRSARCHGAIMGTCLLAAMVNISLVACIKAYSATGANVLGHTKTLTVLAIGWLTHTETPHVLLWRQYTGAFLAACGIIMFQVHMSQPGTKETAGPIQHAADDTARVVAVQEDVASVVEGAAASALGSGPTLGSPLSSQKSADPLGPEERTAPVMPK